jgi:hypothetical protein
MPARSARHYYLHLAIPGWQGRVQDSHDVELRDALTHDTILVLTPAEVVAMLTNYVNHAQITAGLLSRPDASAFTRPALPSAPVPGPLRAVVGVPLPDVQEARRAARAARRKK